MSFYLNLDLLEMHTSLGQKQVATQNNDVQFAEFVETEYLGEQVMCFSIVWKRFLLCFHIVQYLVLILTFFKKFVSLLG